MNRLVADLTVVELYGLLALGFAMFYTTAWLVRIAAQETSPRARMSIAAGIFAIAGLPVLYGLSVIFPAA